EHELTLRALREPRPGERPDASLHLMASLAIFESPSKGLTFNEITQAIEYRFPVFRTDSRWKESLRHSLSVQGGLRRVKKPLNVPGRGDWWII
ncbi:winged helix DNA-binding domain-containing protein, partial [Dendrothele bispora CBS 962.96]